jgi:hypothetical protein
MFGPDGSLKVTPVSEPPQPALRGTSPTINLPGHSLITNFIEDMLKQSQPKSFS